MKGIFVYVMIGALLLSQPVYALNTENNQTVDSIQVNACIEFTNEEAEEYAKSIQEAVDSTGEQLENEILSTDNEYKQELLEDYLEEIEKVDAEDIFEKNDNETYEINIPLNDVDIAVDGKDLETNEDGKISIENLGIEDDEIEDSISLDDEFDEFDVDVENHDGDVEVNVKMGFDKFAKGVKEMSEDMDSAEAQRKCKFYAKKKVGQYFGKGAGKCVVCYNTNIVNCNKCDGSATKKYTTKDFALKNSDCSKSVKLGLVALADRTPLRLIRYYYRYSIFCVQEGMASAVDNKEKNAYCNHKKKSGGHVNCSWFNGIGHSEAFHTHVY